MPGAPMRRRSLRIYADRIDRTRRAESPRAISGCAGRRLAPTALAIRTCRTGGGRHDSRDTGAAYALGPGHDATSVIGEALKPAAGVPIASVRSTRTARGQPATPTSRLT